MDIGIVQPAADPLIELLTREKQHLEASLSEYTILRDRLKKVDECLAMLSGQTLRMEYQKRGRARDRGETLGDAVDRILRNAGASGMTARQIDEELRKTHPTCGLAAVSPILTNKKQIGDVRHIGRSWYSQTVAA